MMFCIQRDNRFTNRSRLGRTRKLRGRYRSGDISRKSRGASDYGDVSDPTEIDAYKVPAGEREHRQKTPREGARTFKQFREKMHGIKQKNCLPKIESEFRTNGRGKQYFEGRLPRLSKVEGVILKGDIEQRRTGWGEPKIKRHVPNAEIQIALRLNALFGNPKRKDGPTRIPQLVPKGAKMERNQLKERKWEISLCFLPATKRNRPHCGRSIGKSSKRRYQANKLG